MKENNQDDKKEFTLEYFFHLMVRTYFNQIKRENFYNDNSCEHIYQWMIDTIRKKVEEEPGKIDYYKKMLKIADKCYTLFSNPKVRDEIIQKDMKAEGFIKEYGGNILEQEKKKDEPKKEEIRQENMQDYRIKYDMSDLLDENCIVKSNNIRGGELGRRLSYTPRNGLENQYEDIKGRRNIVIQEIGRLNMTHSINIEDYITKYRVQMKIGNYPYKTVEVYSDINIAKMSNPQYREAVLQELLGTNNILLSNANGYIGQIVQTPIEMKGACTKKEGMLVDRYYYKINEQYALMYDPRHLSGVIWHERYKEIQKGENIKKIVLMDKKRGERERKREEERKMAEQERKSDTSR